jgi:hypothetical protein
MQSGLYALYLSRAARENLPIGLASSRWGLTGDAVERHLGQLPIPGTGLEILQQLRVGDQILAAGGGPQPRVARGGWMDATLEECSLWRVTAPYYHDTSLIWPVPRRQPGERYPYRFGIEEVERLRNVGRARLGLAGLDALHYSANVGGLPVPVIAGSPVLSSLEALQPGESEDPGFLVLGGDLDATTLTCVRREQRKLRVQLLGHAEAADCSLCRRTVPVNCLRAAHIKRRSECDERERRDLANIMLACTLGCDHLFELGYIYVDPRGAIRGSAASSATEALREALARLEGQVCTAHRAASEPYFAWHRETVSA